VAERNILEPGENEHQSLVQRLALCEKENLRLKDLVVQLSEIVLRTVCKKEDDKPK